MQELKKISDVTSKQQFHQDEQRGNSANTSRVEPKDLLSFLIKEVAMDSQVSAIVIQSEENKVVNMDLTVDKELERIFFPSDADELTNIFKTYAKENNND